MAAVSLGFSAVEIAESVGGLSGGDVVSSLASFSLANSVVATGFSGSDVRVVSESVVTGLSVVFDVVSAADSVVATGFPGSDVRVVSESVVTGLSVVVDVSSAVTVFSSTGVPVITSLFAVGFSEVAALFEGSGEFDFAPVRVSASDYF